MRHALCYRTSRFRVGAVPGSNRLNSTATSGLPPERAVQWWAAHVQDKPGFISSCKIELVSVEQSGRVTLQMHAGEDHMQAMGVVHGGAIVSLADTAAGFGCACSLGGAKLTTVELKANFIGSAFAGDLLMAKAWCAPDQVTDASRF